MTEQTTLAPGADNGATKKKRERRANAVVEAEKRANTDVGMAANQIYRLLRPFPPNKQEAVMRAAELLLGSENPVPESGEDDPE